MNIEFELKRLLFVTMGTILFVVGISFFIVPASLIPGGLTGFATLTQYGFDKLGIYLNLGIIVVIFNIPVMIIGLKGISKTFVYYSVYSILLQGILMAIFDNQPNIFGTDILASSIFGGLAVGLGAGITLKSGSSLGGMDIL
ncbi:MAG: YitT family protein, partial [Candidatus Izemoplasmataceae bacterium]